MRKQIRLLLSTLALISGVTWAHQSEALWSTWMLLVLFVGSLIFLGVSQCVRGNYLRWFLFGCAIFGGAFAYTQWRAMLRLQQYIPNSLIGQVTVVQGTIASAPLRTPFGMRFVLTTSPKQRDTNIQKMYDDGVLPRHISTIWYDDDLPDTPLQVGQEWRLPLSLKPPRATQNEGVFDQEQQWFADDIRGMASVRLNKDIPLEHRPRLIGIHFSPMTWLHNARVSALNHIDSILHDTQTSAVFKALSFGEQSEIDAEQWAVFQQTGVTHLVSISGLHITMLAVLLGWVVNGFWRYSPTLCAWLPSLYAAQWAGLLLALFYALLSGWALPAQRTVYMLALWLVLSRLGVAHSGLRVVCFVVCGVLLFDPFAALSIGFWLSFGAVSWLILAFQNAKNTQDLTWFRRMWRFTVTQLGISAAMLPVTLFFFHQASLLGIAVNLVAIPLVSMLLVPLILLSCVLQFVFGLNEPMLWANAVLSTCVQALVSLVASLQTQMWIKNLSTVQVVLLALSSLLLVWTIRQAKWYSTLVWSVLSLVVLFWPVPKLAVSPQQVKVHILDVGQGSAILLQTATQNWLYDTGPRYSNGFDAGNRIIVPYLRAQEIEKIDVMVLSHNDTDHTGGAASVARAVKVHRVLSSMSEQDFAVMGLNGVRFQACEMGQDFELDGVSMKVLSPNEQVKNSTHLSDNSKSCVLRVDTSQGAWKNMLLTGDIDGLREAELVVLSTGGTRNWLTDVLMVPHHGSVTSSTTPLIEATQPKMAFVQAGYLNAFHHPSPYVMERYQKHGIPILQTVDAGGMRFCLGCTDVHMIQWRQEGRRYWWLDRTLP